RSVAAGPAGPVAARAQLYVLRVRADLFEVRARGGRIGLDTRLAESFLAETEVGDADVQRRHRRRILARHRAGLRFPDLGPVQPGELRGDAVRAQVGQRQVHRAVDLGAAETEIQTIGDARQRESRGAEIARVRGQCVSLQVDAV